MTSVTSGKRSFMAGPVIPESRRAVWVGAIKGWLTKAATHIDLLFADNVAPACVYPKNERITFDSTASTAWMCAASKR